MIDLLNAPEQEIKDYFTNELASDWEQIVKDLTHQFENAFQEEWSKQRFKWLFKKRRQKNLRAQIFRQYQHSIYCVIQNIIEDMAAPTITTNLEQFADVTSLFGQKEQSDE